MGIYTYVGEVESMECAGKAQLTLPLQPHATPSKFGRDSVRLAMRHMRSKNNLSFHFAMLLPSRDGGQEKHAKFFRNVGCGDDRLHRGGDAVHVKRH